MSEEATPQSGAGTTQSHREDAVAQVQELSAELLEVIDLRDVVRMGALIKSGMMPDYDYPQLNKSIAEALVARGWRKPLQP